MRERRRLDHAGAYFEHRIRLTAGWAGALDDIEDVRRAFGEDQAPLGAPRALATVVLPLHLDVNRNPVGLRRD